MRRSFMAVLTLTLALSLCACGGGQVTETDEVSKGAVSAADPVVEEADGRVGVYKLVSISEDGESEDLSSLESMGMRCFLVLSDDGTGCLDMFGEQAALRWDDTSLFYVEEDGESGEDDATPYTYEDGVLTLTDDENSMTFTRLTEEELEDYETNGSGSLDDLLAGLDLGSYEVEIPEGDPSTGPVSGTIDGHPVTILGAERVDEDGESYLRFYYDFTNGGDEDASAYWEIYFDAVQDGEALSETSLDASVPEDENDMIDIAPGETIRCTLIYGFDPDGGTVGLRFSDLDDEDFLYYYVDPQAPSGAPD